MAEMATREHTNESVLVEEYGATTMVESEDADLESLTKSLKIEDVDSSESDGPFSVKTWMEDLTLEVEGRNLYVSKMALATACPGFRKMFEETISTEMIVLNGKKYEDFLEFLLCKYPNPDTLKKINENNVMAVVPLIVEYQVVNLLETCDTCVCNLIGHNDSIEDQLFYLEKASANGLIRTSEKCLNLFIRKDVEEIEKSEKFPYLPQTVQVELMTSMAKHLNRKVKLQEEIIISLNDVKENHEQLKKCFLAGFPRNKRAEIELMTTSGSIMFEFTPMISIWGELKSESVNCGESALYLNLSVRNPNNVYLINYSFELIAELVFTKNVKNYYVKYEVVNHFIKKDNLVKCKESDKKIPIICMTDLMKNLEVT